MSEVYMRKCSACGADFASDKKKASRCPECKRKTIKRMRDSCKKPGAIRKTMKKPKAKDNVFGLHRKKADTTQCRTCLYRTQEDDRDYFCYYIALTGHRRPCEPSPDCTAYERYSKKKRDRLEEVFKAVPLLPTSENEKAYSEYKAASIQKRERYRNMHKLKG